MAARGTILPMLPRGPRGDRYWNSWERSVIVTGVSPSSGLSARYSRTIAPVATMLSIVLASSSDRDELRERLLDRLEDGLEQVRAQQGWLSEQDVERLERIIAAATNEIDAGMKHKVPGRFLFALTNAARSIRCFEYTLWRTVLRHREAQPPSSEALPPASS